MSRDTSKYTYFTIAFANDSLALQKLLQDVKDSGIAPPKLVVLRVSDFYKGVALQGAPSPSEAVPIALQEGEEENEEDAFEVQASLNADAALDEWL